MMDEQKLRDGITMSFTSSMISQVKKLEDTVADNLNQKGFFTRIIAENVIKFRWMNDNSTEMFPNSGTTSGNIYIMGFHEFKRIDPHKFKIDIKIEYINNKGEKKMTGIEKKYNNRDNNSLDSVILDLLTGIDLEKLTRKY